MTPEEFATRLDDLAKMLHELHDDLKRDNTPIDANVVRALRTFDKAKSQLVHAIFDTVR